MKRHAQRPHINRIPGQQFGLSIALKKKTAVQQSGNACECDITGLFWENSENPGDYDQTAISLELGGGGGIG